MRVLPFYLCYNFNVALVKLLQIKQPKSHKGFVLPSVVTASIVMLIVLTVSVSATVTARVALKEQYYAQLGQAAADAGLEYAKSCLRTNSNQPLWTDAKPLKPNTDCSGNETASCPTTSTDAACSVLLNGNIRTVFSIPLPVVNASGYALYVKYNGTTEILRSSTKEVWRSYEQRGSWQTDFDTFVPILSDGLVLNLDAGNPYSYPKFGTTWFDLSGTGSNGTLYNGPTYDSTIKSFSFDGSNDYMDIPYSSTRDFGTSNFTIDIWMKMPSQANRPILELGAYNTNGLLIRTDQGGSSKYSVFIGGTVYTWNYSFGANTWYNAILTRNSSTTMELYVNSVSQGTVTIPAGATVTASSGVTRIAQILSGGVVGGNFIGNIGAIKAYNRSLSATEVTQNYYATRQSHGL